MPFVETKVMKSAIKTLLLQEGLKHDNIPDTGLNFRLTITSPWISLDLI